MICVKNGALEYLTAENISVPHGFTTRIGGVSQGVLAGLNLGMHRGDDPAAVEENYHILCDALGCTANQLVLTHQIHSDIVRKVSAADAAGLDHHNYPPCDALITNTPGVGLVVFTADCTPILLHDPVTGAVGAAHCGWRGTAASLAGKTAAAMVEAFGCDPENICAAIGPNIAQCCFQTDGDVPQAMIETFGDEVRAYIRPQGNKYYVNLKAINALSLRRVGVRNLCLSDECTACRPDRFWSHRVTGGNRGAQGAIILCKEVGT